MSEDRARQLALAHQAIADCDLDFAEVKAQYKARRDNLEKQAFYLRRDILSGQETLPLEPATVVSAIEQRLPEINAELQAVG